MLLHGYKWSTMKWSPGRTRTDEYGEFTVATPPAFVIFVRGGGGRSEWTLVGTVSNISGLQAGRNRVAGGMKGSSCRVCGVQVGRAQNVRVKFLPGFQLRRASSVVRRGGHDS